GWLVRWRGGGGGAGRGEEGRGWRMLDVWLRVGAADQARRLGPCTQKFKLCWLVCRRRSDREAIRFAPSRQMGCAQLKCASALPLKADLKSLGRTMSPLGHKQTFRSVHPMSDFAFKADIGCRPTPSSPYARLRC